MLGGLGMDHPAITSTHAIIIIINNNNKTLAAAATATTTRNPAVPTPADVHHAEAMFSDRHVTMHEADGSIFIDRDGDLFVHVLQFLRNGSNWRPPPSGTVDMCALVNEARYFGLQVNI